MDGIARQAAALNPDVVGRQRQENVGLELRASFGLLVICGLPFPARVSMALPACALSKLLLAALHERCWA